MKNGKFSNHHGMKGLALVLALVLLVGAAIGGTLAWLTATTEEVQNTFSTSDINITLTETTGTSYQMIPGWTITKDPLVTVKAGSEDCYLFVKIEKSANFDSFMEYTVADGWTALTDVDGVYYRVVGPNAADQAFAVLADNTVTVKGIVTKEMMNALTASTYPTLTFTAYASQYYKNNTTAFTAAEAWANVSD